MNDFVIMIVEFLRDEYSWGWYSYFCIKLQGPIFQCRIRVSAVTAVMNYQARILQLKNWGMRANLLFMSPIMLKYSPLSSLSLSNMVKGCQLAVLTPSCFIPFLGPFLRWTDFIQTLFFCCLRLLPSVAGSSLFTLVPLSFWPGVCDTFQYFIPVHVCVFCFVCLCCHMFDDSTYLYFCTLHWLSVWCEVKVCAGFFFFFFFF